MPGRHFNLEDVGKITVYKRKGARNIRLSMAHDGTVRLSIPAWMPYRAGMEFARQKASWISANRVEVKLLLPDSRVGKAHVLTFTVSKKAKGVSVRIKDNSVSVSLPEGLSYVDHGAQAAAARGSVKALTLEAKALLPQRLDTLAKKHGFEYKSVSIKRLKSRWGSCNQENAIILNCFLMQLSWDLIDYVILHELMHTRVLAHGPKFWQELEYYVPNVKEVRRIMRSQRPHLQATS